MAGSVSFAFKLLGVAFAVAGIDKLIGVKPYRQLAQHWDWHEDDMRALGGAELAGGVLLTCPATRRVGGVVLAAASAAALVAEAQHRDIALVVPRGGLMLAALLAAVTPR
jgi:hypothetical protein